MNTDSLTPKAVIQRVQKIRSEMNKAVDRCGNKQILNLWHCRLPVLSTIEEECSTPPQVTISLVGGTGAGKSTLLNALLDVRLLPVSNMRACTAAISEVSFSDNNKYEAEIHFMSRKAWQSEIEQLKADLADANEIAKEHSSDSNNEVIEISRAAKDKLKAVYQLKDEDNMTMADLENLKEDPEITKALDGGIGIIHRDDFQEFRKKVAVFLDSKHQYWPIVRRVKIKGPFKALKNGIKIVDLPGINDPNEERERVTHSYLKNCDFVWIVFNIKRVLTKDTMQLIQSEDFLRQILMDGRAGALTFVGTASDDIDAESAREEFGLDEDTPEHQIISHRNKEVRSEIQKQLKELSARLVQFARENKERATQLAKVFERCRIFTVSAREYMRIENISKTREAGLTDLQQTELIELKKYMEEMCSSYGIEVRAKSHQKKINFLLEEIISNINMSIVNLNGKSELTKKQRKEVEAVVEAARGFLDIKLKDTLEFYCETLKGDQGILEERLKRGIERAKGELESIFYKWSTMHWATIRAVSRRGGRFIGSSGLHDFPADLAKPALNTIMFAWTDFFGDKLTTSMERSKLRLLTIAEEHGQKITQDAWEIGGRDPAFGESLKRLIATTEKVLNELLEQAKAEMQQKIEKVRRTLYESIEKQIGANMQEGFELAAAEYGSGMKMRMIDILSMHAKRVALVMFEDAHKAILEGVRSLADWLNQKFAEMAAHVVKQGDLAAQNLLLDKEGMSADEIENEKQMMTDILKTIKFL